MDDEKNVFIKNKYWLIILFITFIVFMVFYAKNNEGIFFDIPAMFLSFISPLVNDYDSFLIFDDNRSRYLNNFLVSVPCNFILIFIKNISLLNLMKIYSVSYFIVPFCLLILNYFVGKRTQRFDIAAISYAFYFILSIPNAVWACRELHITVICYFMLLAYFLSKTKLTLKDLLPVILLIIYMFESFETIMIYGIIMFIFSNLYIKRRDDENSWYKALIGFGCLCAAIYTPFKMLFIRYTRGDLDFGAGLNEWFEASKVTLLRLFDGNLLIPVSALIVICFLMFYRKNLNFKGLFFVFLWSGLSVFILFKKTYFTPDTNVELLNYSLALWLLFPIIITILCFDYLKIDINSKFCSNLLIITSIWGILNLCWQINTSFYFQKSSEYFKNIISDSTQNIITIPKEDIENLKFLNTNNCFAQIHRSLFFNSSTTDTKIIMPQEYYNDYSQFCFIDSDNTYFDEQNQILYLQTCKFKLKTKYWDLTKVSEEFKKSGRVKNSDT